LPAHPFSSDDAPPRIGVSNTHATPMTKIAALNVNNGAILKVNATATD